MTDSGWSGKEKLIQEDFIWGVGPEALYQISRAEYKTEQDSIKIKDLIHYSSSTPTKTQYLPQPRRLFLGQTNGRRESPEESGEDYSKSKRNATSTQFRPNNY